MCTRKSNDTKLLRAKIRGGLYFGMKVNIGANARSVLAQRLNGISTIKFNMVSTQEAIHG